MSLPANKKIKQIDGLPVYEAVVSGDELGMFRISLVEAPAVEVGFQAFGKVDRKPCRMLFAVSDADRHRVLGCIMRAGFPIYRIGESGREYFVVYSRQVIEEMAERYLTQHRQDNVSMDHTPGECLSGLHLTQYFIKDSAKGIVPVGFEGIEDGSLFAEFHVHNDDVWAEVKKGRLKGFSLEGYFRLDPVMMQAAGQEGGLRNFGRMVKTLTYNNDNNQ